MGIVKTDESRREEIEEFRRMLLTCSTIHRRKDDECPRFTRGGFDGDEPDRCSVCVTSGISYLGRAVVNQLLLRGYSVRVMVDDEEELEKLREMETTGEMGSALNNFRAAVAKLSDVDSLVAAFEGCRGVFHTASFADPAGISGYSKSMADVEVKMTENVIEACARAPSVRKCVLTSSLLTCVWQDHARGRYRASPVINHDSWSDESYCVRNKLWYALGKLRAEKAAWRIAEDRGLRLTAICPGLITGTEFCNRNPTATIAYLKGAKEMYGRGLLATVDAMNLADAHVSVFEEMGESGASGRYICYDHMVDEERAYKLAWQLGMPVERIRGEASDEIGPWFELSNRKLYSLLLRKSGGSCRDES